MPVMPQVGLYWRDCVRMFSMAAGLASTARLA
jgi:hypothetical protein